MSGTALIGVQREEIGPGWVGEVVLNRPEKKNALTPEMGGALVEALRGLRAEAESALAGGAGCALVVRGEGDAFCAGFDLKVCHQDAAHLRSLLESLSAAIVEMRRFPGVVVVGAHGVAVAGGCALLGGADVVVGERGLRMGYPVVRLGISPAVSAPFLVQSVGSGGARTMMLDPELIDAERGLALGLVDEVVEGAGAVVARAMGVAREAAGKPSTGIAATKRLLNELDGSLDAGRVARGLAASVGLVGDAESRRRLAAVWG